MVTSTFDLPIDEYRLLPQYGFGTDCEFSSLVKHNRFLFRVYTPKQHATDASFLAQKFDENYNQSHTDLPASLREPASSASLLPEFGYMDAERHMEWTSRTSSPFISTSFSFAWAIWEALRRYKENVKRDVAIAIIDPDALTDRSVTALELLRKSTPEEYVFSPHI